MQQRVGLFAQGLVARPAKELLGTAVPEDDHTLPVAQDDGVMHQIQDVRLFAQDAKSFLRGIQHPNLPTR